MDVCKDRLYTEQMDNPTRRSAQSAMAVIARSMLALIAPVLTYTADEILEHAPAIFKGEMASVFDLEYTEVPEVAESFDDTLMLATREALSEEIDRLKKEKIIKNTLELEIAGDIEAFTITDSKDLEDWFVVSAIASASVGEELGAFEVEGRHFTLHRATHAKCPRCWRYTSLDERQVCARCAEVLG
jgi:isoleucyl-tRNA synthetase